MHRFTRDPSEAITIINWFTLTDDAEKFERAFERHSHFLLRQPGCESVLMLRLVDRPEVYLQLIHWTRLGAFLQVAQEASFLAQVQRLGKMMETKVDQVKPVGSQIDWGAHPEESVFLLTHISVQHDHQEFETRWQKMTRDCAGTDGYIARNLLRSVLSPDTYRSVTRWRAESAMERAPDDMAGLAQLEGVSRIRTERARYVAHVKTARPDDR